MTHGKGASLFRLLVGQLEQQGAVCRSNHYLERRMYEHKNKLVAGFTAKYNINKLVYFEETSDITSAILREKEIKKWRRENKNTLINTVNSDWKDLTEDY